MAPQHEYDRVKKMRISAILFSLVVLSLAVFITPRPSDASGGGCADQSTSFPISASGSSTASCGSGYNTLADAKSECSSDFSSQASKARTDCVNFCKPYSTKYPDQSMVCAGSSELSPKVKGCAGAKCVDTIGYDPWLFGKTCGSKCSQSATMKCTCVPITTFPPPPKYTKEGKDSLSLEVEQ